MKRIAGILFFFLAINSTVFAQCFPFMNLTQTPANPVCKNTTVTYTASSSIGGISSYIWVVNGDTVSNATSVTTSTNGAYIQLYAISDTCGNPALYSDGYVVNTEITVDYTVIVEECNQPVADIQVNEISGGTEPYAYSLYTSNGDEGQQTLYPDIPVSSYPLVVTDGNGCVDTTWIAMDVLQCPPPDPKEVMTPNEDGYNDSWLISYINLYPDNEVFIYDRWGQRVYHKKGYDNNDGWKAEYLGMNMPVSTYYYILKINFKKQEEQVYNGAISVFR